MENIIIRKNISGIKKSLFDNRLIIGLYATAVIFLAVSPYIYSFNTVTRFTTSFLSVTSSVYKFGNTVYIFLYSLLIYTVVFGLIYLCGISLPGFVLSPIVLSFFSVTVGCVISCYYQSFCLKGFLFSLAIVCLPSLISFIAMILASRESVTFSLIIRKSFLRRTEPLNFSADFKMYCLRYIFMYCIIIASALIKTALVRIFYKMFYL